MIYRYKKTQERYKVGWQGEREREREEVRTCNKTTPKPHVMKLNDGNGMTCHQYLREFF
jgi:hypothetical protein